LRAQGQRGRTAAPSAFFEKGVHDECCKPSNSRPRGTRLARYAKAAKPDAPSGTAREMAERLGDVRRPELGYPLDQVGGTPETRGGTVNGVQVHALRLPSYTASVEAIFAVPGARMTLRHDAGETAAPYVAGTLAAARKVREVKGLVRGLDRLLFTA
jgi:4-hydroxy-tetrahydrodipicolinate reductase